MILRKSYIGPEVDIWSLGVLLYVMVTGLLPFSDPKVSRLMNLVASGKYTIPDFLSLSCQDLIRKIMQVKPASRLNLVEIRDHEWSNVDYDHKILFRETGYTPSPVKLDAATLEFLAQNKFTKQEIDQYCELRIPGKVKAAVYLLRQSSKIQSSDIQSNAQLPATPKTSKYLAKVEPEEANLLASIKKKLESTDQTLDQNQDPVIALFHHEEDVKSLQRLMLENLVNNQGRVFYVDEDYPELFYGAISIQPPEMFDSIVDNDDELANCLESVSTVEMKFSALTMSTKGKSNQTCFKLLNGFDCEWLTQSFDAIIAQIVLYDDYYDSDNEVHTDAGIQM